MPYPSTMLTSVKNLGALKKLRILSMQSNRVTKLEGLEQLECLEELYLSHNGITRLEGLENNVSDQRTYDKRYKY